MRTQKVSPVGFDFYFPELDTLVLVECDDEDTVIVRATRDNFSEQRKIRFIRNLAAEGFIPDAFQFYSGSAAGFPEVRWSIDYSWLEIPEAVKRRANRFMGRALVCGILLWIAAMRCVLFSGAVAASASAAKARLNAPLTEAQQSPANRND